LITSRNRKLRVFLLLILCSFIAAHLCFRLLPNVFEIGNAQAVDQLYVLRTSFQTFRPVYDPTVAHVDLNNASIQRLKNLYLNRGHYARLIRNLSAMGVSAQVFDFIFAAKKDEQGDADLVRAAKEAGNAYFGMAFELRKETQPLSNRAGDSEALDYVNQTSWQVFLKGESKRLYRVAEPQLTYSELAAAARGLGSLSVKFDPDGVLRRVPLLVRIKDSFYPLLPFRVICDYLKVDPDKIVFEPGKHIILRDAVKPGFKEPRDIIIPVDRSGNMIINYIGPWGMMDHYNFADILLASDDRDELEIWGEELRGKIVIVSDVSTGSTDIGPVPTDANYPLSGAHASIIHSILTESFLKELSGWSMLFIEVLLMAAILVMALRFSSIYFSVGALLVAAGYLLIAGAVFIWGSLIFHIGRPILMLAFAMVSIIIYLYINEEKEKMEGLRQRDFIRDTFGRYLSSEVVEELLDSPQGLKMSGEIREVTFLVSDLRGFTALTARLSPHEIIEVINRYFEYMVEVIARYRGVVNEFMGDGILVFFGAPLQAEDDAERAVACAIDMQRAMARVNDEQRRLNLPELSMGIGVNTGEVVVGNIGSERRAAYGAVGSPINFAYRIESYTVGGQILISPGTYRKVQSIVKARSTKEVRFKGFEDPVKLYDVVGLDGQYPVSVPEKKMEDFTRLESPLAFECYPLEGKTVSEVGISGRIMMLGEGGAEVSLSQPVAEHTSLRILLASEENTSHGELYAKVTPAAGSGSNTLPGTTRLHFTWLPEEVKQFFANKKQLEFP
jgi:class 3 adenylate cyclase